MNHEWDRLNYCGKNFSYYVNRCVVIILIGLWLVACPAKAVGSCTTTVAAKGTLTPIDNLQRGHIPLILVHGNGSENDSNCAGWDSFVQYASTPGNELSELFSFYLFVHDTAEPIGFDGKSGNAVELGRAINVRFPRGQNQQFAIVAHSRGGLVARAYMNSYGDGSEGNRVALLLTLATPHHGSPLAVADWGLLSIKLANTFNAACIVNVEYGLSDDKKIRCKAPFLNSPPLFNVNRAGSKDLRWDNFDGPEFGLKYEQDFSVGFPSGSVEISNPHTLSLLDANLQTNLQSGEVDNDLHGPVLSGDLDELNRSERYANRMIAYGGYYRIPITNATLADYVVSGANPHVGLSYASKIIASAPSKNEIVSLFEANDGLVPLQSALFLKRDATQEPIYEIARACFLFCSNEIIYPLQIKDLAARTQIKGFRIFADYDHFDLRDGNGLDEKLFDSIKMDLSAVAVSQLQPTAGFTMSAENQTLHEGQNLQLGVPIGKSVLVVLDADRTGAGAGRIITNWTWKIDGSILSLAKSFSTRVSTGTHTVALAVTDDLGNTSSEAIGTITVNPEPLLSQLFFDGSLDTQQRFLFASFQPPVVDSKGNLLFVSTHFGFSCSFNQCGIRANSIAPSGQLNWQSPNDGTFISFNIESGIALGQNDQLFIPGFSATMFSLDSGGVPVNGWPVAVGPQHFEGPIIADKRLGTVYSSGIASSSFSGFPATVMALNPDGSLKWRDDYPFGRLNLLQGPNRDIYALQQGNVLLGLDHGSGIQFCNQTFDFSLRLDSLVAGPEGLFASAGADVFVIDANCSSTKIFTGNNTNRLTAYADRVLYAFDIPNANDPTQSRLMAVSNAGVLLWKDSRIQFPAVQIAKNGLAYVLGQDTQDSLIPKLFVIDATTGSVLDAADTTQICTGCAVAVADDGSIYISQLGSTKIFRLN